jgi:ketosteroid isomerase-like protein
MSSTTEVVESINRAWKSGRTDDLAAYFAPDMVIVGPDYQVLARGADACVASYRDFLRVSVVHDYDQSELSVHETGGVAVVTYRWDMDFEQGGKRSREAGTDLFVLARQAERWQAVWRCVTFSPANH